MPYGTFVQWLNRLVKKPEGEEKKKKQLTCLPFIKSSAQLPSIVWSLCRLTWLQLCLTDVFWLWGDFLLWFEERRLFFFWLPLWRSSSSSSCLVPREEVYAQCRDAGVQRWAAAFCQVIAVFSRFRKGSCHAVWHTKAGISSSLFWGLEVGRITGQNNSHLEGGWNVPWAGSMLALMILYQPGKKSQISGGKETM